MNTAETLSTDGLIFLLNDELAKRDDVLAKREKKIIQLDREITDKDQKIQTLEEQLAWFKRQIFGKRSEREVSHLNNQQLMLEGFENLSASEEESEQGKNPKKRRKPKRNGQDAITLPPDLPVKTIIIDIPEDQKTDKESGQPLVKIGEEITHKLAHEPASYYIKEIIRPKYALPKGKKPVL